MLLFPFLFGGTFIEGFSEEAHILHGHNFPSFSEGLSLRGMRFSMNSKSRHVFPFLFGGTFIEGSGFVSANSGIPADFPSFSEGLSLRGPLHGFLIDFNKFPFLFGGTFIEGTCRSEKTR